jgi:hypothetical protein
MNIDHHDGLLDLLVRRLDSGVSGAALVDWATRALEQGVETESLVLLAGLARDCSVYDAGPLLDRGLTELNVTVPGPADLRRAYVGVVSRAFLAGTMKADEALEMVHRSAVTPLGHPADLAPWCFVWESLDPADFRTWNRMKWTITRSALLRLGLPVPRAAPWPMHPAAVGFKPRL